jgi:hypothetical protein
MPKPLPSALTNTVTAKTEGTEMSRKDLEAAGVIPGKHKHSMPKETSMEGMPGHIDAHPGDGEHILKGKGFGPKREGPIGERGSGSTLKKHYHGGQGTMTHNYKADSTGKAGAVRQGPMDLPHDKGPSMEQKIGGHPGRMEKLSGRGRTHAEGRKKSQMY